MRPNENRARVSSAVVARVPDANIIERNGRVFTRSDPTEGERDVDVRIIPTGFVYQWNRVENLGMNDIKNQTLNANSGWLPVPAERHDGMWMPPGHKGDIRVGDLRLEERPVEFEWQDRARQKKEAHKWIGDARERFKLDNLPTGFTTETPMAKAATFVNQSNEVEAIGASNLAEIPIAD